MADRSGSADSREMRAAVPEHGEAVRRVIGWMRRDFAEPIRLGDMADVANLSPKYFNHIFGHATGIPPGRYLTALRLEAAKRELLDGARVTDVCYRVGYNSLGTFSSRFTMLVGVSPRQFKALARPGGSQELEDFLQLRERLAGDLFRNHKQPVVGTLSLAGGTGEGPAAQSAGLPPVFIGAFREQIPQGVPAAYTIVFGSNHFTLPRLTDGLYFLFAVAFRWSDDVRSYLLLDVNHLDLLVGAGSCPLRVGGGRVVNRVDVRLRPWLPTDPPLLTALFHFMARTN